MPGLIGRQLVDAGHLTREQLQTALATQRRIALLFGEVCLLQGWLSYAQLADCLRPLRLKLGNKLLAQEIISMPQLWEALLEQRVSGERLGQILLRRGWVDSDTLENV